MKKAKELILLIIVCSNMVLLAVFIGILYYAFPAGFRRTAEEALKFEASYEKALYTNGYWIGTDEEFAHNFLSNNIGSVYPDRPESQETSLYTENAQAVIDVLEFYNSGNYAADCLETWKTENGYYIIYGIDVPVNVDTAQSGLDSLGAGTEKNTKGSSTGSSGTEAENSTGENYGTLSGSSDSGSTESLVMYINIRPFISMADRMIWLMLGFFISETLIMGAIGWHLGARIENAQNAQRKFFQNTSHELKTPLMSIQGYAEGIEAGIVESEAGSKVIMQETDRMTRLVEELLSISKIDANQMVLNKTEMDARELLYDCMYDLTPLANMNEITMVPDFTDQTVRISCDEKLLERAFRNILSNAIRHGSREIRISCQMQEGRMIVQVIDDGIGIAEKDLPHVFERFYTGNGGSTGIGLALADEIVRLHGGKIRVANRSDASGAVFEILMPICSNHAHHSLMSMTP